MSAQIPVRFRPDEEQYIRRRAEVEDRSIASLIRLLVDEAMRSEQPQQQPRQHEAA
jgi:hypothetical protein